MCALLFVTLYFFMRRNHEKYHWAYLVEKNKFFSHEQGTDTIPWEPCGSIIIPWVIIPKKESKSAFQIWKILHWMKMRVQRRISLQRQQNSYWVQPVNLPSWPLPKALTSPFYLLICYHHQRKISGKPVATDRGRHFGFAIMNHFLTDEWRSHLIHYRKEKFPDITKSYSLRGPAYSLVDTCKNRSSLKKNRIKKKRERIRPTKKRAHKSQISISVYARFQIGIDC